MEKPNFVRNGGIKLPIGFRFRPTDQEIVVHYLKRKVHSLPLPVSVISEVDVFQTNPWDLPGDSKEKRYFFCKRKGNVKKCNGITESGYWKGMGKEKCVVAPGSNQAVGVRKSLGFCEGNRPRGIRTHWVMHEYRLVLGSPTSLVLGSPTTLNSTQGLLLHHKSIKEMEDWVVCKIYQKKMKSRKSSGVVKSQVSNNNQGKNAGEKPSSSSCSSGITEISSKGSPDQEETSAFVSFSA